MRLVVDASIAVKWLIAEDDSTDAEILTDYHGDLFAPRLMVVEVANVLCRRARSHDISPDEADTLLNSLSTLPIRWEDDETISGSALRLALALDHPIYDCMYLALAYRTNATFITADMRFAKLLAPTEHREKVITLAEYAKTH